ncbi:hypothetical protein NE237_025597 [Protea cynaroides]|uniref:Uncharacterized protein n=1 Tax=Protea cynaroides TaxID=273540 RepID=A0A9Q0K0C2_9MAGN|nr:hypothetical protein NE237_025597 [Protea cynaroides]
MAETAGVWIEHDPDVVTLVVESILRAHGKVTPLPSNRSIFRVPEPMRVIKPEAYTPRLVSIGPFHRNDKHLKPMEAHKLRYLYDLLDRESPKNLGEPVNEKLGRCVEAMIEVEDKARRCYSETIEYEYRSYEFVHMMVVDGCFILEFILKTNFQEPASDPTWMTHVIKRDLLLLENQLPLFVLGRLYNLLINRTLSDCTFSDHVCCFLGSFTQSRRIYGTHMPHFNRAKEKFLQKGKTIPPSNKKEEEKVVDKEISEENFEQIFEAKHLLDFNRVLLIPSTTKKKGSRGKFGCCIRSATELHHEALVKFQRGSNNCLLGITFTDGVLRIPSIRIEDFTETLLRNLIAFEQSYEADDQHITYYAAFLDGLINTPEDVELLQKMGIIQNLAREPQEVAYLFNNLLKEVIIEERKNYFSNICCEVNEYYGNQWNQRKASFYNNITKWKASLMENYFNSPWAFISFLAAVILLILTAIQTFCSIKQVT